MRNKIIDRNILIVIPHNHDASVMNKILQTLSFNVPFIWGNCYRETRACPDVPRILIKTNCTQFLKLMTIERELIPSQHGCRDEQMMLLACYGHSTLFNLIIIFMVLWRSVVDLVSIYIYIDTISSHCNLFNTNFQTRLRANFRHIRLPRMGQSLIINEENNS